MQNQLSYEHIFSQFFWISLLNPIVLSNLITFLICKIHFRTLQIVYNSYDKSYQDLLNFSDDVSIHQKHFGFLAIEVYKSLMNINPEFMWEFSNTNPVQYNLRKGDIVNLPPVRSSCYGINSLALRGRLLWNSLPSYVKQSHNLEEFKLKLRNWGNIHCTCVACRWI